MSDAERSLRQCLDQALDKLGYKERAIELKPIDTGASNFTTTLFQVTVTSLNKETLNLFAKTAIIGDKLREEMDAGNLYAKEFQFYTKLVKAYEGIYNKYNIPKEKRIIFSKYYGATIAPGAEVLILEDLAKANYKLFDRMKAVDWEHAKVSMTDLARFHALGFALQKEDQELFKEFQEDYQYRQLMLVMKEKFEKMLSDALEHVQDEYRDRVTSLVKSESINLAILGELGSGRNTLIHGDYRTSNIMFKRQNGKLCQVPLDFQGVREGNVFVDIYFFIALNTDEKFRKYHMDQLMDLYYTELSSSMRSMGVQAEEVYPRKDFEEDCKTFLPYCLVISLTVLPLVLVDTSLAPDMSAADIDMETLRIPPSAAFKTRLAGLIRELAQKGVF